MQTRAATTEFHRLSTEVFSDLSLGLLHGRMPLREKEDVMGRFQSGELDVLVSTPVVEVGIDNRNASVILIDGADRFGLAQLHQFRGRVGRGEHASYCMLMSDYPSTEAKGAPGSHGAAVGRLSPSPRRTCVSADRATTSARVRAACRTCAWRAYQTRTCWPWRGRRRRPCSGMTRRWSARSTGQWHESWARFSDCVFDTARSARCCPRRHRRSCAPSRSSRMTAACL